MDKNLEMFITLVTLKHNLKIQAELMGFENKNGTLFIKPDVYDLYLKFDDEFLSIWYNTSDVNYRKIIMYYEDIYDDINKNRYTKEDFFPYTINMLSDKF